MEWREILSYGSIFAILGREVESPVGYLLRYRIFGFIFRENFCSFWILKLSHGAS